MIKAYFDYVAEQSPQTILSVCRSSLKKEVNHKLGLFTLTKI